MKLIFSRDLWKRMSCIHNWSPRLSLYLKRQVTIWRDSSAAIMKRPPPYPVAPPTVGHGTSPKVPSSVWSPQLQSVGNRERAPGTACPSAEFWKGRKLFSKWPDLLLQSYTVKVQGNRWRYCLCLQTCGGFQSNEENHSSAFLYSERYSYQVYTFFF